MKMTIKFVVNEHRKDKHKKPPKPTIRSQFTQYLWDNATFKECDE